MQLALTDWFEQEAQQGEQVGGLRLVYNGRDPRNDEPKHDATEQRAQRLRREWLQLRARARQAGDTQAGLVLQMRESMHPGNPRPWTIIDWAQDLGVSNAVAREMLQAAKVPELWWG